MTGSVTHWVPAEDALLRELAQTGETGANIAKQMHRSIQAIRNRASKLQIALGRVTNQAPKRTVPPRDSPASELT